MTTSFKNILLSSLLSVGVGIGAGLNVPLLNGLITGFFTSPPYNNSAQSHRFVIGITLGYGVLFAITTILMLLVKISKNIVIYYPLSGLIALSLSIFFRALGSNLGTLDCGTQCVDTVVPQSAQKTATSFVTYTITAIFIIGVLLYVAKVNNSAKESELRP